jgi:hypothetical protein
MPPSVVVVPAVVLIVVPRMCATDGADVVSGQEPPASVFEDYHEF